MTTADWQTALIRRDQRGGCPNKTDRVCCGRCGDEPRAEMMKLASRSSQERVQTGAGGAVLAHHLDGDAYVGHANQNPRGGACDDRTAKHCQKCCTPKKT